MKRDRSGARLTEARPLSSLQIRRTGLPGRIVVGDVHLRGVKFGAAGGVIASGRARCQYRRRGGRGKSVFVTIIAGGDLGQRLH